MTTRPRGRGRSRRSATAWSPGSSSRRARPRRLAQPGRRSAATRAARARGPGWSAIRCFALLAVVAIGLVSRGRDARLRAADRPAASGVNAGWDHRPIGKNCEIGRLGTSTSHFLNEPCRPPFPLDPRTRPCRSPRPPGSLACTRTRSGPGATPAGCATTGSTRAATAATGSVTSSASWPPPRPAPPTAPRPSPSRPWGGRRSDRPGRRRPVRAGQSPTTSNSRSPTRSTPSATSSTWRSRRALTRLINAYEDADEALSAAVHALRDAYGHHLVAVWEARGERLVPRAVRRRRCRRARPPRRPARSVRDPRQDARAGRRPGPDRSRRRCPASCSTSRATRCRSRSCPTAGPSWPWRSPVRASRGASCTSSARPPGSLGPRDLDDRPGRRRRARRDRQRRPARRRGRPPAPSGGGAAPGRQRHRQPARPRPDPVRPGRPRDGPVRGRPGRGLPPARRWPRRRRGQPRPVDRRTSRASATSRRGRCRPPPSPPAGRCSRSTTATIRAARTSGRPSSRKASTRCARRRCSTARELLGLLNVYHDRPAPLDRPTSSTRSARSRPRRASPSGPPRTSSGWRPGPPSSSRSSSSARGSAGCRASPRSASRSRPSCAS